MKLVGALVLAITLAFAKRSSAATLPDACGDDKTTFDVKVQKDQPAPALPDAVNAQIVFIEKFDNVGLCVGCEVTTRVGVDGKWVGADRGNSYFSYTVTPAEHHLCVNWQGVQGHGPASFKAEPGKVYYFAINVKIRQDQSGMEQHLDLAALNESEGKYLVKNSALAAATPKK
jgi:hypothetical protein